MRTTLRLGLYTACGFVSACAPVATSSTDSNFANVTWIGYLTFIVWVSLAVLALGGRRLAERTIGTLLRLAPTVAPPRSPVPIVSAPVRVADAAPYRIALEYLTSRRLTKLAFVAALVWVIVMATRQLETTGHWVHFSEAFAGVKTLLPITGFAAIKLWSFWAFSAAVVTGLLLQIDPELDFSDAVLAGAAGVWVIAYLLGQVLGPIGLFRPAVIWILLAGGVVQIWRKPPRLRIAAMSTGQKLALLAFGLVSVGMVLLELGSPLVPYMDVLTYAAATQRILSFGYHPFDNDPFGCWGPRAETPGLELFFAMLAMGSRVKLGVLAQSGTMVPMAALIIFTTYRLGVTLAGDTVGGMAALFLSFTNIVRRMTGMRGTAVDFALVALGLAFFLDRRRSPTLVAMGAIVLGAAVAGHAIDGGLAMLVAAAGALLWLAQRDSERFAISVLCLSGAALFAMPEVAIGMARHVAYPLLPLCQLVGLLLILLAVRRLSPGEVRDSKLVSWLSKGLVALLIVIVIHSNASGGDSIFTELMSEFPLLFLFALGGLIIWAASDDGSRQSLGAAIVVIALLAGTGNEVLNSLMSFSGSEVYQTALMDVGYKLKEYWCPYFLIFPAAIPFALLHDTRERTRLVVILALLTLLIYPWLPRYNVSYDYNEHSIPEEWNIELSGAAGGGWPETHDSRWTMNPDDFALVDFLRAEQASGRIGTDTHILHIAHDANVTGDFNRFSVFTGIDDDPIIPQIEGWAKGSRTRTTSLLAQALAERPPYILEQVSPPSSIKNPPDGYEEVFRRGTLRLLRRTAQPK